MCLDALNENQKKLTKKPVVIPWRVSKLTLLLQPYFEYGNVVNILDAFIYICLLLILNKWGSPHH